MSAGNTSIEAGPLANSPGRAAKGRLRLWASRFLAGNPSYLVSAALLLFGINRLSVDPGFLGDEEAKLAFNFSALQVYEILLVAVAIVLARRRIWYDATLLVFFENVLVLVPFILVAQAALISTATAWFVCVAGVVLAVLRIGNLKHFIPGLNLPGRLFAFGAVVLAVNLALPIVFRRVIESGNDAWENSSRYWWLAILPLLLCLANGLPRPARWGGAAPQRSWLPLTFFLLWVVASCVHLYCVGYLALLPLQLPLLAPLVWTLSWTLYNRLGDFQQNPDKRWQTALLFAPTLATLPGAFHENSYVFLSLTALNVLIYGCHVMIRRENRIAYQLFLASGAILIAGVPESLGKLLSPEFSRQQAIVSAIGAWVLLHAVLSRRAEIGLCGAVVAALVPGFLGVEPVFHLSVQAGVVFLLLHSLRWEDHGRAGLAALRLLTAGTWTVHSFTWTNVDGATTGWVVSSSAVLVLAVYAVARMVWGRWGALAVPAGAVLSFLAAPAHYFVERIQQTAGGLLAILGSFLLFGLGTFLALTRNRWQPAVSARNEEIE